MIYRDEKELFDDGLIEVTDGKVEFKDLELFRDKIAANIADTLILSHSLNLKKLCYWLVGEAASKFGIIPASIQSLYEARAKEGFTHFTVPAMNLRTLTYDSARAAFRAAKRINAASFIFEIARSEIGYTEQRPRDYTSSLLLAAISEGFQGPLFIQGDHFQVKAKDFFQDRDKEANQLKGLISEAINEKKSDQTDDQFIYKTRKKALGPFKKEIYSLPLDLKNRISLALEEEFSFLFEKLNIKDTKVLVNKYIKPVKVKKKREDF